MVINGLLRPGMTASQGHSQLMVNTCYEALKTGVLFATCSLLVRITFANRAIFANKNRTRSEGETTETRRRSRLAMRLVYCCGIPENPGRGLCHSLRDGPGKTARSRSRHLSSRRPSESAPIASTPAKQAGGFSSRSGCVPG